MTHRPNLPNGDRLSGDLPNGDDWQNRLDGLSAAERRALRKGAPDDRDLAAYLHLYDALEDEPAGALPDGFAEATARRAFAEAARRQSAWLSEAWTEGLAIAILLIGAVAGAFWLVPGGFGEEPLRFSLSALAPLWNEARLDLMAAAALTLLLVGLIDHFGLPGFSRPRRTPTG